MNLLDPNTGYEEISDELLIQEFKYPNKYKRMNLYALMARRAIQNVDIRNQLFDVILDEKARKEVLAGRITHAWLPAIFILRESNTEVWFELKQILKRWTKEERKSFLDYISSEHIYYNLLWDILP